jgi:hypothetical protein
VFNSVSVIVVLYVWCSDVISMWRLSKRFVSHLCVVSDYACLWIGPT